MPPMRAWLAWLKQHSALIALGISALCLAAGAVLLVLATRPSRFVIEAGECLQYRLVSECAEVLEDGSERATRLDSTDLLLVGTGQDNQAALVALDARQARTALVEFEGNGAARVTDAVGRNDEGGLAQGWFDLSLCILPPGNDQIWTADLVYAALPAHRRAIQAKVRRTRSGSSPEFLLALPNASIEWINASGRYEQIRDLKCVYKFSNSKHAVESAELTLKSANEREDGRHRYRWKIVLTFVSKGRCDDQSRVVRDLALTGAALNEAMTAGQRERASSLVSRLGGLDVDDSRLREVTRRLINAARVPPVVAPTHSRWAVQVLVMPTAKKSEADRVVRQLGKQGFKAYVAPRPDGVAVMVGPYDVRDPALSGVLASKVPLTRPTWVSVPRE